MRFLGTTAALIAFSTFAYAGEMEGTIKSVDPEKKMIELTDGMSMMTGDSVMLGDMNLMAGDRVSIMTDENNMVTDIKKK
jgi:hypothetical protein